MNIKYMRFMSRAQSGTCAICGVVLEDRMIALCKAQARA